MLEESLIYIRDFITKLETFQNAERENK